MSVCTPCSIYHVFWTWKFQTGSRSSNFSTLVNIWAKKMFFGWAKKGLVLVKLVEFSEVVPLDIASRCYVLANCVCDMTWRDLTWLKEVPIDYNYNWPFLYGKWPKHNCWLRILMYDVSIPHFWLKLRRSFWLTGSRLLTGEATFRDHTGPTSKHLPF